MCVHILSMCIHLLLVDPRWNGTKCLPRTQCSPSEKALAETDAAFWHTLSHDAADGEVEGVPLPVPGASVAQVAKRRNLDYSRFDDILKEDSGDENDCGPDKV